MKKCALSLLLALVMVIGLLPVTASANELDNGLRYMVYDDHVEITGYTGNATEVVIPAEIEGLPVTSIGNWAFEACSSLTGIMIPDGVTSINYGAFYGCSSLTSIVFPDSVSSISDWAFYNCTSLTSIMIPDNVSTIGEAAFSNCKGLTSVVMSAGITSIESYAFSGCESLTSISIPATLTSLGDEAFNMCYSLTGFVVDEGNSIFSSDSHGVLFNKDKSKLIQAPCTISGFYSIPDSVTSINNLAFQSAKLVGVTIPASITSIGSGVFNNCKNLNNVSFQEGVTRIGDMMFRYCESLVNVTIPASITHIDDSAFEYCANLNSITFCGDAPDFGLDVFYGVTATVYYPASNTTWTEDVLKYSGGNLIIIPYDTNHIHEYSSEVIAPTCTEQGYTTYTCSCGDSYAADYVDALGHDYAEGTCTRCGEADPNHQPARNPFTDVPAGAFYEAPVLWALENGITTGATADTFNPNGQCLRAHVVTFLHRAAGNPEPTVVNNPFTDVKTSDFFYAPVLWAVEKGITNGTGAATFGSYDVCNRAAVVTFLWRAAGSPEPKTTDNPFTDVRSSDFFYKPVLWAIENGITNGVDATHFGPTSPCNRAQVVTFLYRAYN